MPRIEKSEPVKLPFGVGHAGRAELQILELLDLVRREILRRIRRDRDRHGLDVFCDRFCAVTTTSSICPNAGAASALDNSNTLMRSRDRPAPKGRLLDISGSPLASAWRHKAYLRAAACTPTSRPR